MNKLEQELVASAPRNNTVSTFTEATIAKIKKRETFSNVVRTTDTTTKRRSYYMKLLQLRKTTLVLVAIIGVSVLSGTAYATYQLLLKPEVGMQKTSIDENGSNQLVFDTTNCTSAASPSDTKQYEVKSNSAQSVSESEKRVLANCEIAQIRDWVVSQWPGDTANISDYPVEISSIKDSTYGFSHIGDDGKSSVDVSDVNDETLWVDGGKVSDSSQFAVGDSVVTVRSLQYADGQGGAPTGNTLLAVVKLSLPASYYSIDSQNKMTERQACTGNAEELCGVSRPSVDVYYNPGSFANSPSDSRSVEGKLVSHDANGFVLRGSSGKEYYFKTTADLVNVFNQTGKADYGIIIEIDDRLKADYFAAEQGTGTADANKLTNIQLLLESRNKNDAIKKLQ